MKELLLKLALSFMIFISCSHIIFAQDAESDNAKLSFISPKIANPADPDPRSQNDLQRTETLRKRTQEAIALIDKKDSRTFFTEYVDPFWLARNAAGTQDSVNKLFEKHIAGMPEETSGMLSQFKRTLEASLQQKPQYLLEGRAASFMKGHNSRTAEFWIYFDGKWRISPET